MESNITINIVEPGSTPIEPVVPDTGLFTSGIGGPEATILGITAAVIILAVIIAVLYYRNKKQGKFISLKHKKATAIGLASLAAVVSLGTVAGLLKLGVSAVEDGLTVTTSSEELTIELADEPIFAVLPVELTVAEATEAGYTLTAYAEDTNLVSTTDSSNIIPMVTVEDGLVALADNTYGLALVEPESKEDAVYTILSTDVDNPTLITDKDYKPTEAEDTTTIYYGFYITPDAPKGTYTGGNINYEAQPNYITTLSFDGNGSDGGKAMEGMTLLAGDTITLPQNTYTREGYSFTGWNTQADGEGKAYADETEFTASLTESEDITLYAKWEENALYMQEVATWGSSLQVGDEITAIDSRDGKEYYVARLADNNIWMTQNLDFNIVNGGADLDSTNTDVPAGWADAGNLTNTYATGTTTWNDSFTTPQSYDPGELYWNGDMVYNQAICETNGGYWISGANICSGVNFTSSTGNSRYHLGNYYNWTAAVAMSDSSSYTSSGIDVDQSICPAGWRLPNLSENKSYQNLVDEQSLTAGTSGNIQNSPVYFVYGGAWQGSFNFVGSYGQYWSSVIKDDGNSYSLYFRASEYLNSQNKSGRLNGFPLRCVVR